MNVPNPVPKNLADIQPLLAQLREEIKLAIEWIKQTSTASAIRSA